MSSVSFVSASQPSIFVTAGKSTAPQTAATQAQPNANSSSATISQAARDALAAAQNSASSANSSATNSVDAKLAEIMNKVNKGVGLTSSELDYEQKASGFVNSMANLSPAEKDLYDKAVASGNKDAAAGISLIAMTRQMGHMAGGAPGTTYDPINTAITAANIEQYFSHSIVDPSGKAQSNFQALIQFLQNNPAKS